MTYEFIVKNLANNLYIFFLYILFLFLCTNRTVLQNHTLKKNKKQQSIKKYNNSDMKTKADSDKDGNSCERLQIIGKQCAKIRLCLLYKLFRVKWAKEIFFKNVKLCVWVVLVTSNNILLVYKTLGTITFHNFLFFSFFFNFNFLINSKPKQHPISPMAQQICFLT